MSISKAYIPLDHLPLVGASRRVIPETLYYGDDALSTKPVMYYQGTAYLCY